MTRVTSRKLPILSWDPVVHRGDRKDKRFGATTTIGRPIGEVFAFLADGENDKKFSARIVEISKATDAVGGYDLVAESEGTKLTFFNELEGRGFGKLIAGFATTER